MAREVAAREYGGGVTASVVVTCLMAASCGLIFGYDVGISGENASLCMHTAPSPPPPPRAPVHLASTVFVS
ncbi:hypothetical protein GUJ93_ZPchr0014g47229 [Zizania palustris]|uniref:Major facilitator superfamily (MFS) profile domain-containing protein n=1 Tax=Zizania palustris TaxID=103762 RepID=A0A8J5SWU8_ZIZPA|nr:hypothetical protein GUJ93_ZPchr0014g47229 [Zizania palustris]